MPSYQLFPGCFVVAMFLSYALAAFLCKWMVFCIGMLWLSSYLLWIQFRFLLHGYHEAYIKYKCYSLSYAGNSLTLIAYKTLSFTPLLCFWCYSLSFLILCIYLRIVFYTLYRLKYLTLYHVTILEYSEFDYIFTLAICWKYMVICFHVTNYHPFISAWLTTFSISCKAGLAVISGLPWWLRG